MLKVFPPGLKPQLLVDNRINWETEVDYVDQTLWTLITHGTINLRCQVVESVVLRVVLLATTAPLELAME
jgi:hypothetical protein